jgi:hypothetical protein
MPDYQITVNVAETFLTDSRGLVLGAKETFKAYPIEITVQENLKTAATAVVLPHNNTTLLTSFARRIANIISFSLFGTITQPDTAPPTADSQPFTVKVYSYVLFDSCEDGVPGSSARLSLLDDIAHELEGKRTIVIECESRPTPEDINDEIAKMIQSLEAYQLYMCEYSICDCDLYAHKENSKINAAPVFKNKNSSILGECYQKNLLGQAVCEQCCQELSGFVSGLFNPRNKSTQRVGDDAPLLSDTDSTDYGNHKS